MSCGVRYGVVAGEPHRSFAREVTNMRGATLARTRAGLSVRSGSRVGKVRYRYVVEMDVLARPAAAPREKFFGLRLEDCSRTLGKSGEYFYRSYPALGCRGCRTFAYCSPNPGSDSENISLPSVAG